jgi:hypothetical protein
MFTTFINLLFRAIFNLQTSLEKPPDTVGEPPRAETGVPNMPSLKAKKLSQLPREKVLLELGRRLANSIPPFFETLPYIRTALH